MPYVADRELESLFDPEYVLRTAAKILDAIGARLLELVIAFTPVASDPFDDRSRAEVPRAPGTLKRSWKRHPVELHGETYTVEVDTDDEVAPHVEFATRPHLIRPTPEAEARALARHQAENPGSTAPGPFARLRFRNSAGTVIFAKEVHHPGTHGAYMMTRALHAVDQEAPEIARRILEEEQV